MTATTLPTLPREEYIAESLVSDLLAMRRADGFWTDITDDKQVERDVRTISEIIEMSRFPYFSVVLGRQDTNERGRLPKSNTDDLDVEIRGMIKGDATDLEKVIRDVRVKILANTTRGAHPVSGSPLARWTVQRSIERDNGKTGYEGMRFFIVTFSVRLQYEWSSP